MNKTFVCLEGIEQGNRFFTSHTEGEDDTRLSNGEIAYTILGYADTPEEARKILYGQYCENILVKRLQMFNYMKSTPHFNELGISDIDLATMCSQLNPTD